MACVWTSSPFICGPTVQIYVSCVYFVIIKPRLTVRIDRFTGRTCISHRAHSLGTERWQLPVCRVSHFSRYVSSACYLMPPEGKQRRTGTALPVLFCCCITQHLPSNKTGLASTRSRTD